MLAAKASIVTPCLLRRLPLGGQLKSRVLASCCLQTPNDNRKGCRSSLERKTRLELAASLCAAKASIVTPCRLRRLPLGGQLKSRVLASCCLQTPNDNRKGCRSSLERKTRLELATSTLARLRSQLSYFRIWDCKYKSFF